MWKLFATTKGESLLCVHFVSPNCTYLFFPLISTFFCFVVVVLGLPHHSVPSVFSRSCDEDVPKRTTKKKIPKKKSKKELGGTGLNQTGLFFFSPSPCLFSPGCPGGPSTHSRQFIHYFRPLRQGRMMMMMMMMHSAVRTAEFASPPLFLRDNTPSSVLALSIACTGFSKLYAKNEASKLLYFPFFFWYSCLFMLLDLRTSKNILVPPLILPPKPFIFCTQSRREKGRKKGLTTSSEENSD